MVCSNPGRFKPKTIQLVFVFFSAKHAALRRKSKYWLARNQINVSKWSDMSTRRLLFQRASTINIKFSVLISGSVKYVFFGNQRIKIDYNRLIKKIFLSKTSIINAMSLIIASL